jgi:hypothetical protein
MVYFPSGPAVRLGAGRQRPLESRQRKGRQREREGERARTSKHGIAMIECTPEDICTVFLGSITPLGAAILEGGWGANLNSAVFTAHVCLVCDGEPDASHISSRFTRVARKLCRTALASRATTSGVSCISACCHRKSGRVCSKISSTRHDMPHRIFVQLGSQRI